MRIRKDRFIFNSPLETGLNNYSRNRILRLTPPGVGVKEYKERKSVYINIHIKSPLDKSSVIINPRITKKELFVNKTILQQGCNRKLQ